MGKKSTLKDRLTEPMKEAYWRNYENNIAQARLKWYDHWARVCGVESWEDIDWSNPVVSLEWKLCDQGTQAKLMAGRRDEVLATFTEEEQ